MLVGHNHGLPNGYHKCFIMTEFSTYGTYGRNICDNYPSVYGTSGYLNSSEW